MFRECGHAPTNQPTGLSSTRPCTALLHRLSLPRWMPTSTRAPRAGKTSPNPTNRTIRRREAALLTPPPSRSPPSQLWCHWLPHPEVVPQGQQGRRGRKYKSPPATRCHPTPLTHCSIPLPQYSSGRGEEDFIKFINDKTGAKRQAGGLLTEEAGRIDELDALAKEFAAEVCASLVLVFVCSCDAMRRL